MNLSREARAELRKGMTPGPWLYHEGYIKSAQLMDANMPDRGREVITEIYNPDNARAIALAPAMLDRIDELEAALQVCAQMHCEFPKPASHSRSVGLLSLAGREEQRFDPKQAAAALLDCGKCGPCRARQALKEIGND